jgi:hypothetical protein
MRAAGFWSLLDEDDAPLAQAKIRAFQLVFALVLATEYWVRAAAKWGQHSTVYLVSLAVVTVLASLVVAKRWTRLAFAGLAATQAVIVWREFPATGNHAYLELVLCIFCALLDARRGDERTAFLRAVRWTVCVVLFYSGLQKLVHGYWFDGQYLAFSVHTESFRPVLALLMPASELERLLALRGEVGDGPYRVAGPLLVAVSNAVYASEMLLAAALLWRTTRAAAVAVVAALLVAIELGAREVFFGLVFASALLLFLHSDLNRRLVPAFIAVLLALLLSRAGMLPEATFY